jgi:hypothetical protein
VYRPTHHLGNNFHIYIDSINETFGALTDEAVALKVGWGRPREKVGVSIGALKKAI